MDSPFLRLRLLRSLSPWLCLRCAGLAPPGLRCAVLAPSGGWLSLRCGLRGVGCSLLTFNVSGGLTFGHLLEVTLLLLNALNGLAALALAAHCPCGGIHSDAIASGQNGKTLPHKLEVILAGVQALAVLVDGLNQDVHVGVIRLIGVVFIFHMQSHDVIKTIVFEHLFGKLTSGLQYLIWIGTGGARKNKAACICGPLAF